MPVTIKKTNKGKYRVSTPSGAKSKWTTRKTAQAQERLLNAIEYSDWNPTKSRKK